MNSRHPHRCMREERMRCDCVAFGKNAEAVLREMCPADNHGGSPKPAERPGGWGYWMRHTLPSFSSLFQPAVSPLRPSAAAPSPFKRSRGEAFERTTPPAPPDPFPPAQPPTNHSPCDLDREEPKQAKRPFLGPRVAELAKGLQTRRPMDAQARMGSRAAAPHEAGRNDGDGRTMQPGPSSSQSMHQHQPQLQGHAGHQQSALEPKTLPFESPRQLPVPAQPHQRAAMPSHDRPWILKQWNDTSMLTPIAQPYGQSSRRQTPMHQSSMYSRPSMASPAQRYQPSYSRPPGQEDFMSYAELQQKIQDAKLRQEAKKRQPLPQAVRHFGIIDLSAEEDFKQAQQIGQRRKETADKMQQHSDEQAQLMRQLSLAAEHSLATAVSVGAGLELDIAAQVDKILTTKRAAQARRNEDEAERMRQLQEAKRRADEEAAAAAAREVAERQRQLDKQKQVAAEAEAREKNKKKKKQAKKQEETIVIESSEEEDQAPPVRGVQNAAAASPPTQTKRSQELRKQQKGFGILPEEEETWRLVFDQGAPKELLIDYRNVQISREKLLCMQQRQWLNDEAINMYMLLLQERDAALRSQPSSRPGAPPAPRCHFFNSFFLSKLYRDKGKYEYKAVQRWTSAKKLKAALQASPNLLEVDRILMPVNCGNVHWTCCCIDVQRQQLIYYDSMGGKDVELLENLARYMMDEARDKCNGLALDTSNWQRLFNPDAVPQQKNGCDCGVFTIMFADRLGLGVPFDFSQADMDVIRVKVLHRLISNKI